MQPGSPGEPPALVRPQEVAEPGAPASHHIQSVVLGCCIVGTESCRLFRDQSILVVDGLCWPAAQTNMRMSSGLCHS